MDSKVCVQIIDKLFEEVSDDVPSLMHHYTSPGGLLGVLSEESLYFTNSNFLNDSTELRYIYDVIEMAVDEKRGKYSSKFTNFVMNQRQLFADEYDEYRKSNYYICSFSTASDALGLWNYFSKRKDRAGYNVTFDSQRLLETLANPEGKYTFKVGRVVYDVDEQVKMLDDVLIVLDLLVEEANPQECKAMIGDTLAELVYYYGPYFKHPAFKNEEECRLVCRLRADAAEEYEVREQQGLFVPYLEIPFAKDSVKAVTISPYVKSELKEFSVHALLDKYGYESVCHVSKIPVRF